MDEMEARGYHPDPVWRDPNYRGKVLGTQLDWINPDLFESISEATKTHYCYPAEHNDVYLQECIDNLKGKGIEI